MHASVIDIGFGDSGKGRVVDWLCREHGADVVIRFSGGQQAAHHVITKDIDHVFSSFGSGTLIGVPTYIAPTCTVDPIAILNEHTVLEEKSIIPELYVDGKCPVTTPYERKHNYTNAINIAHGTCGCGIGSTWQREEDHHSILFEDLFFKDVLKFKLKALMKYYHFSVDSKDYRQFTSACELLSSKEYNIELIYNHLDLCAKNIIFEGSQGVLLDQKHGFFPNVTRSHTDTKSIREIEPPGTLYLVTRAYQTRHGNGPMTNENIVHSIKENPHEQNFDTELQGAFRRSLLDLNLLVYARMKDPYIRESKNNVLVITCLDLVEDAWSFTIDGDIYNCSSETEFVGRIKEYLNITNCLISRSPSGVMEEA